MDIDRFLSFTAEHPVFEAEILRAGKADPRAVNVRLSRWKKAGKIVQLRRGLYLLNNPYVKLPPRYDLYIAAALHSPSYLSLQKALEYHGLIPEGVAVYTSVTTRRPVTVRNPVGEFSYRHIKQGLFWGYEKQDTGAGAFFVAHPEKALLDLIYLEGVNISAGWLEGLRLQNLEALSREKLLAYAGKFSGPGMLRAARELAAYLKARGGGGKHL